MKCIELKDFPGYYVTNEGEIYSINYNRMGITKKMTPSKDGKGYLFVSLRKDGKRYIKKVHRLVAQEFIPNPENILHAYRVLGRKPSITIKIKVE